MFKHFAAAVFLALSMAIPASGATLECPRYQAPGKFNNHPVKWGKTDTGVIVNGFVDLISSNGKLYDVLHGADLSSHNTVQHNRLKECGATFSFVRLDKSYMSHKEALEAAGMTPLPYIYFPIPKSMRYSYAYDDAATDSPGLTKILTAFEQVASQSAERTLAELSQHDAALNITNLGGLTGKILAVDIEEKLLDEKLSASKHRVAYGRGYARALCEWTGAIKRHHPDTVIILYTMPAVYGDYLRYALPEDNACLSGLPVWLAHTTSDAGDSVYSSTRKAASRFSDESAQRLCLISSGNRCIVHQYSHRATFAAQGKPIRGQLPRIDINRWFPVVMTKTASGDHFVRRDQLPPPAIP